MSKPKNEYINREISWLHFNDRVLQESADKRVPLIERLRFLGIFSNNLDEFFKVRYATVKRIVDAGRSGKSVLGGEVAKDLLEEITKNVIQLQAKSGKILTEIEEELEKENIFLINETEVSESQTEFVSDYFYKQVNPQLITIILNNLAKFPKLKDTAAYLAVRMVLKGEDKFGITEKGIQYALIEIPKKLKRFVVLPPEDGKNYIMMVDDVIRFCMDRIFSMFEYAEISSHMIKITRDAELDMDNDLSKSFIEKISSSVDNRKHSDPVRFVYDKSIKMDTLRFLKDKMGIEETDSVIPGGRYHNRRDYMGFPSLGRDDLQYDKITALPVKDFNLNGSILEQIAQRDYMIYTPYQTFSYVINFLKEAALDPKVRKIKLTVYRLANNSQVAAALINAAKNGKEVTVQIELQARFDEQANIKYANQFQEEGIKLIFGIPGLKVHTKVCFVEREEDQGLKRYGFISTGNFNESTAKIYTDYTLFTAHAEILKDVNRVFDFFEVPYQITKYKHLIVSPHYTKTVFTKLIDTEIANAKNGLPAYIKIKMNSFTSYKMVDKLYEASRAGVKIQMIIRGICCLVPGVPGMSENIEAISVVDKFLEHPRVFIFGNNDNPKVYISSADWMTRNIDYRVEVGCPIYDEGIKQEVLDGFSISWRDNVKGRVFSDKHDNAYKLDNLPKLRSQFALYDYYKEKLEG
ncbi:Polyphosphate kinase [Croceitalea dokdonensis DOKDO 023]|uniref:Polyphosphate kinase n=1 Tax=Croceitalea dokdonensis DOKDO 023 TaxID=1300341 RepID=A0A0P7ARL0_9FLAO|nr:polyphosphate kinase 1 [Croceitalea dokdonensis]KPM30419.1 Polyphosphate kinase [Croceitalea dokdonensis DOKDO 023]